MSVDAEALQKENELLKQRLLDFDAQKTDLVPIDELRKVRAEAAENRKKYQEYERKIQDIEPNVASLLAENTKLKSGMDRLKKETAVITSAMQKGFNDPSDAVRLLDIEALPNDDDNIEPINKMIDDIIKSKPYLVKSVSPLSFGGGPTNPAGNSFPHAKPELTNQNSIDNLKKQAVDLTKQGRVTEATALYNRAWEAQYGYRKFTDPK